MKNRKLAVGLLGVFFFIGALLLSLSYRAAWSQTAPASVYVAYGNAQGDYDYIDDNASSAYRWVTIYQGGKRIIDAWQNVGSPLVTANGGVVSGVYNGMSYTITVNRQGLLTWFYAGRSGQVQIVRPGQVILNGTDVMRQ